MAVVVDENKAAGKCFIMKPIMPIDVGHNTSNQKRRGHFKSHATQRT
jgi:hypothetical protein